MDSILARHVLYLVTNGFTSFNNSGHRGLRLVEYGNAHFQEQHNDILLAQFAVISLMTEEQSKVITACELRMGQASPPPWLLPLLPLLLSFSHNPSTDASARSVCLIDLGRFHRHVLPIVASPSWSRAVSSPGLLGSFPRTRGLFTSSCVPRRL